MDHVDSEGRVPAKFRQDFPSEMADRDHWVTTHCPPGADLANGLMASAFGLDPIWRLRLLPVAVGLASVAFLFQSVIRLWGIVRGTLIAVAVAVLPTLSLGLPSLHQEGYSVALVFVQTGLLLRTLWEPERPPRLLPVSLFLIGFVQGWLSWDQFFLVSLLAVPWWLLRRAEGENPSFSSLVWMTAAPAAGYALAHILHFWQVAAELHLQAAVAELHRTGLERGGLSAATIWLRDVLRASVLCLQWSLKPTRLMFGPFFGLLLMLALPTAIFSVTKLSFSSRKTGRRRHLVLAWPGNRSSLPALVAALLVCALWLIAMPAHVVGNSHYTTRHFITLYLLMAVIVARSLHFPREEGPPSDAGFTHL